MIPTVTAVRLTLTRHRTELPLLVLGPALGTSATALWSACAGHLADSFDVLAWDLPGHGHNRPASAEGFDLAELAAGVLRIVDDVVADRGDPRGSFAYAGDSVGGAVGLQLLLDAPSRVTSAVLVCSGARLGTAASWAERVAQIRDTGTAGQLAAATERWFTPGFLDREPERAAGLFEALRGTLDDGYVQVCQALAGFDVRDRLGEVSAPVLAVAGSADVVTPPALLREVADGVQHGTYAEIAGAAHLAPAEAPEELAALVRTHLLGPEEDRAADELPETSVVAIVALAASGRHDELATHLRSALRSGWTAQDIEDVLRETAVHAGSAEVGGAFAVARQVLTGDPLA